MKLFFAREVARCSHAQLLDCVAYTAFARAATYTASKPELFIKVAAPSVFFFKSFFYTGSLGLSSVTQAIKVLCCFETESFKRFIILGRCND